MSLIRKGNRIKSAANLGGRERVFENRSKALIDLEVIPAHMQEIKPKRSNAAPSYRKTRHLVSYLTRFKSRRLAFSSLELFSWLLAFSQPAFSSPQASSLRLAFS